jgi:glyceraldehyde 3-phosphate dehydrogenase
MSDKIRIGINGFGRIGRCTFKQMIDNGAFDVVGINDLADLSDLAYLLKYDSVHHWYPRKVDEDGSHLIVDGKSIPFSAHRDPADIPWGELGADIVIEATGALRKRDQASRHLDGGAGRVLVSAPSGDLDGTFVYGVNSDTYDPERHRLISNASCTTNCLAPVVRVLHDEFGIDNAFMTTVHAYTASQSLVDTPASKRRRGRAAAMSIIPSTTGATVATTRVIPELEGRLDGMAMRVPVPDGSVCDIVARLETSVTAEEVNRALTEASERPPLEGVLRVTDEALVSTDILGDPHSSIIDAESTMVLGDRTAKVLAWYDNEWGYSGRLVDMAALMAARGV